MQKLFTDSFTDRIQASRYPEIKSIYSHLNQIDKMIEEAAPQFPIKKIAKIDVAILRLAVYELSLAKKVPFKVAIDEAVELAKEFGSEHSSAFINGVLGTIHKKIAVSSS